MLQTRGSDTPSPIAPPVRFVSEGPYAWVRNPINPGESFLLLGMAAWFASRILLVHSALSWLSIRIFIIAWEAPMHRRLYGRGFARYCVRVRSGVPRSPTEPA